MKKYVNNSFINKSPLEYKNGTKAVTSLPVEIFTDGQPVSSYTLKGNTSVSGTPSPSNPVTIEGVGEETANLFDEEYPNIDSSLHYLAINVGNGDFTLSTTCPRNQSGACLFFLAGNVSSGASTENNGVWGYSGTSYGTMTRTQTAVNGYVTIAYRSLSTDLNPVNEDTMLNAGSTAQSYEPMGFKISISSNGTPLTPIYLSQPLRKSLDGTAFDTLDSTGLVTYNVDEYGQPQTATTETVTVPTITTTGGTVTLDVDTTIKPSELDLTYHGWHSHEPLKRENGAWV